MVLTARLKRFIVNEDSEEIGGRECFPKNWLEPSTRKKEKKRKTLSFFFKGSGRLFWKNSRKYFANCHPVPS
jgi:hypothetical protein